MRSTHERSSLRSLQKKTTKISQRVGIFLGPDSFTALFPTPEKKSSKQTQPPRHLDPKMLISQPRSHPTSRSPVQKPDLNQKRLIYLLERILLLRQCCSQSVQPHRPTIVLLNNRPQQPPVQLIEPMRIHLQQLQRCLRRRTINDALRPHLRIVPHPPQQAIGNSRRPPRPHRNLSGAIPIDRHTEHFSAALDHKQQLIVGIKLQAQQDPKPRPQRRRQYPRSRCSRHKRKRSNLHHMGSRRRPLPDDDVQLIVLERRIKLLLQHGLPPVNLIEKQNLLLLQIRENRGQIPLNLQRRPTCLLIPYAHLIRNNGRERRFPQPRRPKQQHVVQRLSTRLRRLQCNRKLLLRLRLPNKFSQPCRPELRLKRRIILDAPGRNQPLCLDRLRPIQIHLRFVLERVHSGRY